MSLLRAHAQCPSASFTNPSNGCIDQKITLQNSSSNATSYYWDFCSQDLQSTPSSTSVYAPANSIVQPQGIKTVFSQGKWYGFITNYGTNHLVRVDFGDKLDNISPTYTDLGTLGKLAQPEDIDLLEVNGNWYAIITQNNFNGIILVDFGSSLTNTSPTTTLFSLATFNIGTKIRGVSLAYDNSKIIMVVSSSTSYLSIINFGNSFYNTITNSDILAFNVPGSSPIFALDILKTCNNWYIFASSLTSSGLVHRIKFGTDLFSSPSEIITYTIPEAQLPVGLTVVVEGSNTYVAVSKSGLAFTMINFGDLNVSPTPVVVASANPTNFTFSRINVFPYQGKFIFLGVDYSSSVITSLAFANNCGASLDYSTLSTPDIISYSNAGATAILLAVSDGQTTSQATNFITISNQQSPAIDFTTTNNCVNNPVLFNPQADLANIVSYDWDFGDGNNASGTSSPSNIYSSAAVYNVKVDVIASNGCPNYTTKSIQIFNPPQANFTLPAASPLCTNQNYLFTNTSTSDAGSNPTWQWNVNSTDVSITQDLNYLFTSSSSQSISLTASIPGCSTQSIQSVNNLNDGPLVSFNSPSTSCAGTNVSFTNTTSGSVINTSWTYGDGNSSSQTDGTNAYSAAGTFSVKLSSSNAAGCQNSFSKNISIYSLPQTDFVIEAPPLSCANTPSKFDNLTAPLTDSNVSTWNWSFGDVNNGSSNQKNPSYLYTLAGNYNVSLQAITNFGCSKSMQKQITISPSPHAGFTSSAACVNQSAHFSDASTGSITSYQWNVQNIVLSGAAPSYVFKSSGSFPVTLTVTGSNGCLNQTTKSITVPVMPVVDFSVSAPCTGHPTHFQEVNFGGADPAIAWNWNFEQSSGTGSPVSYQFASEGGHTVIMNTTRQSGCVYSISKNISISAGPTASFSPSVFAGAAPLDVSFNNTSTADSYMWQFDDVNQTTSTTNSPEFVYPSLGKYKVLLTAYNTLGCSDTLSTEIDVVVPHIDIEMNNFYLTSDPNSNSSKAVVTILNSGNIPLLDPEVLIDFGGNASIKEKISGLIRPGKSLIQTLGLQIVPRSLQYICAEIDVINDVNSGNNKQCVSLSNEDVVMTPYPNPSTSGQITIEWVGAVQENAVITIFRSNGEIAFEQSIDEVSMGLGQITINTSSFSNGLYLVQFSGGKTTKTFRIMIAN